MFTIDFEPIGRRGSSSPDLSLLECAHKSGIELISICGGAGTCERCKIQVLEGQVSPLTEVEQASLSFVEIQKGYRLACQAFPLDNVKLFVPPESLTAPGRTQVEGMEVHAEVDPPVRGVEIGLHPPSPESPLDDSATLWNALATQGYKPGKIDLKVLQELPQMLRQHHRCFAAALKLDEVVSISSPGTHWLGMAVDIGTTKIAGYLIDMVSGVTLASTGILNPQISCGDDIISRIDYANRAEENRSRLQSILIEALNSLIANLCASIGAQTSTVVEAVIVGNTVMHHLLMGLPVRQLGESPYVPVTTQALEIKARDLGMLIAPGAYVHTLPIIAGYVGADHTAMLLATRLPDFNGAGLAIDIGTNTEICLNYNGKLTSVSCASGPAFEGAHIRFGMRAAPGAIEHVRITGEQVEIQTIWREPPAGICGSGLVDAIAQMRIHGILERSGKFAAHPRVRRKDQQTEFLLAERGELEPITISQQDVREMQLAKAAIRAGIQVLVKSAGISESDLDQIILAGAFGTYIDVQSAVDIGMLPALPVERFKQVGNAAGTGARLALISIKERLLAQDIARKVGYLELAKVPGFSRTFTNATFLE